MGVDLFDFRDVDGSIPLLDWLKSMDDKARSKVYARMRHLGQMGHKARRPHVENVGGGLYELRARWENVNYRIIYFVHGRDAVILSHGFTKERKIPKIELDRARERMVEFSRAPEKHKARIFRND